MLSHTLKRRKTMPALAPKSALAYRPVHPDVATEEPPRIARASRTRSTSRETAPRRTISRSHLRFVPMSLGMVLMLFIGLSGSLLLGWVQTAFDDLHYGRPRIFQID